MLPTRFVVPFLAISITVNTCILQGCFHGRKRLVVRPQYHIRHPRVAESGTESIEAAENKENDEEIRRKLAQAFAGHLADVRR